MKQLILYAGFAIFLFAFSLPLLAQTNTKHVYVKGYTRKDGTYVRGHYRTAPNSTNRDNFSTKGNYNPYTGKAGWIEPDNKAKPTYEYNNNPEPSRTFIPAHQQSSTIKENSNVSISISSGIHEVYNCSSLLDQPRSTAKEIDRACDGTVYVIEKYNNQYYKVTNGSAVGYLPVGSFKTGSNSKYNSKTSGFTYSEDTQQQTKQSLQKVVSGTYEVYDCVIIYNQPDQNTAREIGKACNGSVYVIRKVNDNYYRINYGSVMGYIHRNSLK